MAHYIDGKDCMVRRQHVDETFIVRLTWAVTDLRMDPLDLRVPVRCGAHLHAFDPVALEVGLV